jgi:hypothetical protein
VPRLATTSFTILFAQRPQPSVISHVASVIERPRARLVLIRAEAHERAVANVEHLLDAARESALELRAIMSMIASRLSQFHGSSSTASPLGVRVRTDSSTHRSPLDRADQVSRTNCSLLICIPTRARTAAA